MQELLHRLRRRALFFRVPPRMPARSAAASIQTAGVSICACVFPKAVSRARKVQRFLSQPFHVAEQFTGYQGKYVPLKETIRGFREIVEGKHDDIPESAFLFAGGIDDVVARAKGGEA